MQRAAHPTGAAAAAVAAAGPAAGAAAAPTHYAVRWAAGGTDAGSSGAALLDAAAPDVAWGVLTGGSPAACGGSRKDYFGSLAAAWPRGLWRLLSPRGIGAVTAMPAADAPPAAPQLPALITSAAALQLGEGAGAAATLSVRLSAPPPSGQEAVVTASVRPAAAAEPGAPPGAAASNSSSSSLAVSPQVLRFSGSNWSEEQQLRVAAADDVLVAPPASFELLLELELSSGAGSSGPSSSGSRAELAVPGCLLDDETPAGATPQQPLPVPLGAGGGLDFGESGTLLRPGAAAAPMALGQALSDAAAVLPRGAARFYSLGGSMTANVSLLACSADAPLQVALFPGGGPAAWCGQLEGARCLAAEQGAACRRCRCGCRRLRSASRCLHLAGSAANRAWTQAAPLSSALLAAAAASGACRSWA